MRLYRIFYNDDLLYIGSTIDFRRRKWQHENNLKNNVDKPLYKYLKENNIKFEDLVFEIIETDFNDIKNLRKEEGNFIKKFKPLCNKEIAGRTRKEYRKDNIEKIKESKKEYYEINIDKIKERHKKYYNQNADFINQRRREAYNKKKQEKQN